MLISECPLDIGSGWTRERPSDGTLAHVAGRLAVTPRPPERRRRSGACGRGRERPPRPRAWYGRGAVCVFTRWPRALGVAPRQQSLAGRPVRHRLEAVDHALAGRSSVGLAHIVVRCRGHRGGVPNLAAIVRARLPRPVWTPSCKGPISPGATPQGRAGWKCTSQPSTCHARHQNRGVAPGTAAGPGVAPTPRRPRHNRKASNKLRHRWCAHPKRVSAHIDPDVTWDTLDRHGRVGNRLQFTAPCPRSGSISAPGKAPRSRHDSRKDTLPSGLASPTGPPRSIASRHSGHIVSVGQPGGSTSRPSIERPQQVTLSGWSATWRAVADALTARGFRTHRDIRAGTPRAPGEHRAQLGQARSRGSGSDSKSLRALGRPLSSLLGAKGSASAVPGPARAV